MQDYKDHLYALIVAGGGGTRLWPRSRKKSPKQFLKLFNKQTLTQITAGRFSKILPWEKIYVVTVSEEYKREILKEVPKIFPQNIIVEPVGKNTAPAHGIGAAYIYKKDPEAVILNESADHLVKPESKYFHTLMAAAAAAASGDWIVTIGIKPTYPGVGYGHIKRDEKYGDFEGVPVYKFGQFVEKPDLATAKKFNASGNYFWNANLYVWKAQTYLKALRTHEPRVGKAIDSIYESIGTDKEGKVIVAEYGVIPEKTQEGKPMSIDYAVSEKAKNILLIVAEFDWADIGDWSEVWENLPHDKDQNVIIDGDEKGGRVINIDTTNTLVHMDGRLITIVDVDDIAIVDTKDILLVCKRSRAQSVKKIVEQLKAEKKKDLL
jgi:mannose-1-phosphate guanylyltransferase